jgi:hypothetical protein
LLLHLKRFIFVEKRIEMPSLGIENETPNSPSSKRQSFSVEYVFQKNRAPVTFTECLSLAPFQKDTSNCGSYANQPPPQLEYQLKSIVHHIGGRPSSGHYTADTVRSIQADILAAATAATSCSPPVENTIAEPLRRPPANDENDGTKEFKDGWVTFDDGSSCITTLEKIKANKKTTAYMLLYSLSQI